MKVKVVLYLYLVFLLLFFVECWNKENLVLSRFDGIHYKSSTIEIDTLEKFYDDSIIIINIVKKGALGHFKINLGFIRNMNDGSVIYECNNFESYHSSTNYIVRVDQNLFGVVNWGWFNLDTKGEIIDSLPFQNRYRDSLQKEYKPLGIFVNCNLRGEFFLYKNGKKVKVINYGNLLLKDSMIKFGNLENKVYEYRNNKLFELNNIQADDIFKRGTGLYFVSRPGIGIVNKIAKKEIFHRLMEVRSSKNSPKIIKFRLQ